MFSLFNGLPSPPHLLFQPAEEPDWQNPTPPPPIESRSFLHAGSPRFEPDLTHEVHRDLNAQAAGGAGDVP
jgi:hypothetical protein